MTNDNKNFQDVAIKILAALGIIAVLIFVGWGTVRIAKRYAPNALSSVAAAFVSLTSIFTPSEKLIVSASPAEVESGESVTISWKHEGQSEDGSYALSYECREGFFLKSADGQTIFCNTQFDFLANSSNSITVTAVSGSSQSEVLVPITIHYKKNSSDKDIRGTVTITAIKQTDTGTTGTATTTGTSTGSTNTTSGTGNTGSTPKPVTPGTPTNNVYRIPVAGTNISDPNGRIDLSVRILDLGIISTSTNLFVATSTIHSYDRGAVRFEIVNVGTKNSGSWSFNAVLPTVPSHIFQSDLQQNLGPGDKIEFTLAFDSVQPRNNNTIILNVDPANSIPELSEANNIVKISFDVNS